MTDKSAHQAFIIFRLNPETHKREFCKKRKWVDDPLFAKRYDNWDAAFLALTERSYLQMKKTIQNPQTEGIVNLDSAVFAYLTKWHSDSRLPVARSGGLV